MPPKRAKTGEAAKNQKDGATARSAPEDLNRMLEAEMLTLEVQLQETDDRLMDTLKQENLLKEKIASSCHCRRAFQNPDAGGGGGCRGKHTAIRVLLRSRQCEQYEEDLKAEERRRLDICADLVRRHKALQHECANQIEAMQATLQGQKRDYVDQMALLKQLAAARDKEVAEHDARIKAVKLKMDRVSEEFVRLLTEIQDVMTERLKSPLLDARDETQRFSEVLEASKGQYFKKLGEIIRDREEKHPLGSGWRGAGTKAPKAVRALGVS
ncbi:hypothetical protein BESB_011770 [Besnoitia besnoiti]|uniref:Coiled-coil domain-containing protein 153 n=1 Tax=Besnoitia besnoiti TaxID=94643 RepID=A0A2A9M3M8_BESBE|nr:hypothetical protein BESB_011770 [Besnoitia besnoiti]PFH32565.1 hypothetical protein BESB_011770 [Besnoitia besnoiti]